MAAAAARALALAALAACCWWCTVDCKISSPSGRHQAPRDSFHHPYLDVTICRSIPGLSKPQLDLCFQQPDAMRAAMQGLNHAVKECQYQFQGNRWNCSTLATRGQNPYVSTMMQRGFKETAFAYAMASAGVAVSIAKACSAGQLMNCGCDSKIYKIRKPRQTPAATAWKWGGCSHNLRYGVKFSKMFLDSREKADDVHSKTNLHNNQVGRTVVSTNMQVKCKCHGMSGSCQLKTCWRAVPDIRVVGKALKEKYRSAIFIDQGNLGTKNKFKFNKKNFTFFRINSEKRKKSRSRANNWIYRKNKIKRDLSHDLLFFEKSPNFCEADSTLDVAGTTGRVCNRTRSTESNSCSNLCCGRGYDQQKHRVVERCNCKFHWCCEVMCQTCITEDWISVCK